MESAYLCIPALKDAEYRQSAFGAFGWVSKEEEREKEREMGDRGGGEREGGGISMIWYSAEAGWAHGLIN